MKLFSSIEVNRYQMVLSCQARVTVMSCFVHKVIRAFKSIDHLCINPILRPVI